MIFTLALKKLYPFSHGKKAWHQKHINDPYVKKAQQLNYRSRASFKLIQLIQKHPNLVLKNNKLTKTSIAKLKSADQNVVINNILDLGSSPGSWSQIVKQFLPKSNVVAVDLLQMKPIDAVDFYKVDARSHELHKLLKQKYGKFELVISDMAPNFIGDSATTHQQILQLNSLCVKLCYQLGASTCSLIMKSVQGQYQKLFYNALSSVFNKIFREKPDSSRSGSIEFFYVCQNLKQKSSRQAKTIMEIFDKIGLNPQLELQKHKTKKESLDFFQKTLKFQ